MEGYLSSMFRWKYKRLLIGIFAVGILASTQPVFAMQGNNRDSSFAQINLMIAAVVLAAGNFYFENADKIVYDPNDPETWVPQGGISYNPNTGEPQLVWDDTAESPDQVIVEHNRRTLLNMLLDYAVENQDSSTIAAILKVHLLAGESVLEAARRLGREDVWPLVLIGHFVSIGMIQNVIPVIPQITVHRRPLCTTHLPLESGHTNLVNDGYITFPSQNNPLTQEDLDNVLSWLSSYSSIWNLPDSHKDSYALHLTLIFRCKNGACESLEDLSPLGLQLRGIILKVLNLVPLEEKEGAQIRVQVCMFDEYRHRVERFRNRPERVYLYQNRPLQWHQDVVGYDKPEGYNQYLFFTVVHTRNIVPHFLQLGLSSRSDLVCDGVEAWHLPDELEPEPVAEIESEDGAGYMVRQTERDDGKLVLHRRSSIAFGLFDWMTRDEEPVRATLILRIRINKDS